MDDRTSALVADARRLLGLAPLPTLDACCVPTAPLAKIVSRFVADWSRTRPRTGGQFTGRNDAKPITVSAEDWLVAQTRRNGNPGLSVKAIRQVAAGRPETTELRVADALVAAIGRPELFYDGTLPILPNPHADPELRASCCGSSG